MTSGSRDLVGKVAVVTGAAGGIGRATAKLLNARGARLVLTDLEAERLESIAEELRAAGGDVMSFAADTSDSSGVRALIAATTDRYEMIDIIVLSAGIFSRGLVEETTDDDWQRVMDVNLGGIFRLVRAAIPRLTPSASIVTVASLAGHRGSYGEAHYAASKAGVVSLTMSLALELGPRGIRANAVSPGLIKTTMTEDFIVSDGDRVMAATPLGRFGTAREVAEVIAFLASDAASYVTGAHVHVNGGSFMSA